MNFWAKIIGIVMLVAGAGLVVTGVGGMADSQGMPRGPVIMRLFGGIFLFAGGAFTTVFAFHSHFTRGFFSIFNRFRGRRIDEEISRLAKLRADGFITGEEYEAAKRKLLGEL
jgi:hypothetical protein